MENIDFKRIVFFVFALSLGFFVGWFGQPLIHGNKEALNVIVTVYSIFAGFLVAVMAIMGDPGLMLPGSWRIASIQRKEIRRRLHRQIFVFHLYLVTLGLIFASFLLKDKFPNEVVWLEKIYLGLAVTGFVLSLRLPSALMGIQEDRFEAVIQARKINRTKPD